MQISVGKYLDDRDLYSIYIIIFMVIFLKMNAKLNELSPPKTEPLYTKSHKNCSEIYKSCSF